MTASSRVTPRSLGAFLLITLIWGSTWLVIKDQIGALPVSWAVAYRFVLAALAMFALALVRGERLRLPAPALGFAAVIGLLQFFGNFQFVYRAEHYITSGLVAVLFALLLVPNTLLARIFLGTKTSARFVFGSAVALAGIALLVLHEFRAAPAGGAAVLVGIGLTLLGLMSASISNVMQSAPIARAHPPLAMLGWAMAFGAAADVLFALITAGPPPLAIPLHAALGVGYLALLGSVVTFPLYFALIRDWGPGPAAYSSVLIPVVAMALSTLFEGYRWSPLAAGGAVLAMAGLVIALSRAKAGA